MTQLRTHIDQIYRERALASCLRETPIFRHLSDDELEKVMSQTEFGTYGDYDWSGEYKRLAQSGGAAANRNRPSRRRAIIRTASFSSAPVSRGVSQKFGNGERTLNYLGAGQHLRLCRKSRTTGANPDAPVPLQYSLARHRLHARADDSHGSDGITGVAHPAEKPAAAVHRRIRKRRNAIAPFPNADAASERSARICWNFSPKTVFSTARPPW